jgi:hypothetical protein
MKVLFFAPHSAIWVHAYPEALVAEALQQSGHEVVYVTCGEALNAQCVPMTLVGVDYRSSEEERRRACGQCHANQTLLREEFGLRGPSLGELLRPADLAQIDDILRRVDRASYLQLELDSIPVGRYATYELITNRKKNDPVLDDDEWREYLAALKGALAAYFAAKRLMDVERPDRVVSYNSLYGVNRVVAGVAGRRGIPCYFLHAGSNLARRLQTLWFGRDSTLHYAKRLIGEWPRFRDRPCPAGLIEAAAAHMQVLFRGESVFGYSSAAGGRPGDIRSRLGIGANQRVLVATMSSQDERFAAVLVGAMPLPQDLLFPTQVEWIKALVAFVQPRPDLFLVIRVHPREFPNKRDPVRSRNAELLREAFAHLPPNACVNWPSDQIALYDLANCADVFLNCWSSAGKEMALLGLPVVVYSADLLLYPADLNYLARSVDEYFGKIGLALDEGWSLERSRQVFRWLALEQSQSSIDIGDAYAEVERRKTLGERAIHKARRMLDPLYVQRRDCTRRPARIAQQVDIEKIITSGAATAVDPRVDRALEPGQPVAEERALRSALARIGRTLYGEAGRQQRGSLAERLLSVEDAREAA